MKRKMRAISKAAAQATALIILLTFTLGSAKAQVLASEQTKKIAPTSYYFAGQSAAVQARNTGAFKSAAGKIVLAGLVDTSGYSTAIAEKYQGFLITETKLTFDGATLEPGQYGFGFKEGKFTVMNVAAVDIFSISCQKDDQLKHPVPLMFEKNGSGYKLYAGRAYISMHAD